MKKFWDILKWWLAFALVIWGIVNLFGSWIDWLIGILVANAPLIALSIFILGIVVLVGSWILDSRGN